MGYMKDLLITIHGGGDEAVKAVQRMGDDWRAQLEQAAKEVEGLRLTPEECDAIRDAIQGYSAWMLDHCCLDRDDVQANLYRLNGIVERHATQEVKS